MIGWNRHLGNILTVYAHSDKIDRRDGMQAYYTYDRILTDLGKTHGIERRKAIAVFAALSPNSDYKTNLESTRRLLRGWADGVDVDDLRVTTYGANKRKAWSILEGEDPLRAIVADKTRSFYLNILDPTDPIPVTIDGHMFSVWNLKRFKMQEAQVGSGAKYARIAADYRRAAEAIGIIPNQLQAVCWFAWKRLNLISVDRESLQHELPVQMPRAHREGGGQEKAMLAAAGAQQTDRTVQEATKVPSLWPE